MYTDIKYVYELSSQLEMFKVKNTSPFTANCRCKICGDSKKSKTKARGYFYTRKGAIFYRCHNCGHSCNLGSLLKLLDPEMFKRYRMEKYVNHNKLKSNTVSSFTKEDMKPKFEERKRLLDNLLDRVDVLNDDHIAVKYLLNRQIPKDRWHELYYIDNIKKIENLSSRYRNKIKGIEPRLVIPFYNRENKLISITCRALTDHHIRYLTITINSDEAPIFNLNKINFKQHVYVTEGPFDSMFLPNAIAVGTSDLKKVRNFIDKQRTTFIFDNQPRNKEIVKFVHAAVINGFHVFFWPENISGKDINELVTTCNYTTDEILQLINSNTFAGMAGYAAFAHWKKI